MVLLMCWEDKIIEHLTARDGAVVAHNGVDETGTIFEIRVVPKDKLHRRAGVEYAAAITYNTIDEDDVFAYLRGFLVGGVDGDVLEFRGSLDITVGTYLHILDNG